MKLKKHIWLFVAVAIVLSPFFMTGCGSDDTEDDKKVGVYTIGPGNLEKFPSASVTK